jgi:hypothetical protein
LPVRDASLASVVLIGEGLVHRPVEDEQLPQDGGLVARKYLGLEVEEHSTQAAADLQRRRAVLTDLGDSKLEVVIPAPGGNGEPDLSVRPFPHAVPQ